jgi:hypothetical protein
VGDVQKVYGTYTADYGLASEKLTLSPDGSFVQEVKLKVESKTWTSRGTWQFDEHDGLVTFPRGFLLVVDGWRRLRPDYGKPSEGAVILAVEQHLGGVQMGSEKVVAYWKR